MTDAVGIRVIRKRSSVSKLTLLVDASLEGWRGVVVEQSGALTVVGGLITLLKNKILNDLVAVSDWLTTRELVFSILYAKFALNPVTRFVLIIS